MNVLTVLLQGAAAAGGSQWSGILMIVALFAIMYFFMIRPQQKKQKEIQKMREALTVGDEVVTAGGIYGKIKNINDTTYSIEIAEGVKIKVEKTSVFAAQTNEAARK